MTCICEILLDMHYELMFGGAIRKAGGTNDLLIDEDIAIDISPQYVRLTAKAMGA